VVSNDGSSGCSGMELEYSEWNGLIKRSWKEVNEYRKAESNMKGMQSRVIDIDCSGSDAIASCKLWEQHCRH
jgi:hypothetical protein